MYKRLVQKVDKDSFLKRCDDNHIFFYHKASDYKGLKDDKYEFKTEDGTTLRGHFYYYPNYNKKELIIFCHGFGGGHRSYLDYINFFCLNGYRVLAYDYKGTFESDGENLGGFSEPIVDLLALLNTLKKEGYFDKYKVSCIGHSWGYIRVPIEIIKIIRNKKNTTILGPLRTNDRSRYFPSSRKLNNLKTLNT